MIGLVLVCWVGLLVCDGFDLEWDWCEVGFPMDLLGRCWFGFALMVVLWVVLSIQEFAVGPSGL